MQRKNNITYLLGAGASCHSIPIMEDFNDVLYKFFRRVDEISETNISFEVGEFTFNLLSSSSEIRKFNTVDTYAKKLFLQENIDKLNTLKTTISLFLAIWQQMVDKDQIFQESVAGINGDEKDEKDKYDYIDYRYISLLSSFLQREKGKIVLNDNINFISWNYDVQLEMALQQFTDIKYIHDVIDAFNIYPPVDKSKNTGHYKIVHLNGIAGLYETTGGSGGREIKTLFNRTESKALKDIINEASFIFKSFRQRSIAIERTFSFAWEENEISKKAIEEACRIMAETNVLVIIGYSFPAFNKDIDKRIFKHFYGEKVFYQDPNANSELLFNRFDIMDKKISVDKNAKQFTLPLSYL